MKKINKQKCVYCINAPSATNDHVIPRSMFPLPKPTDLITVPSCLKCNRGFKKDEEYFLGIITFTEAGVSAEGKRLWDQRLQRMYKKDRGLRRAIARAIVPKQVFTPAGLYLGKRLQVEPDWPRIKNYFTKVIRGLYHFEYDEILPESTLIHYVLLDDMEMLEEINRNVRPGKRGWNGVLEYKQNRIPDSLGDSLWLFLVYETLLFGATTYQESSKQKYV